MNKSIIKELGDKVKDGKMTWSKAAKEYNNLTSEQLSAETFRGRYRRLNDVNTKGNDKTSVFESHNSDDTIDITKSVYVDKKIWFDNSIVKTPEMVLDLFGYSIDEWDLISWTFGKYEVAIKEEDSNRECITVRARIKPKVKKELTTEQYLDIAKEVFSESIKPYKAKTKARDKKLDPNKLLELTGIELHLGKLAWNGDTGQDYDKSIAQERFYNIVDEIIEQQNVEQCDTCLLCIGNDFFNSDTVNNTTTKGTPQQNDMRFKKMFNTGLEMYTSMLLTLREKFNHIEVRLQSGNHDYMSSFYLYMALSCYFKNDNIIQFSSDYKDVQCFKWGRCAIFFTHGDTNLKRLIKSIPAEFYEEWGTSIFRELHLGHLHSEIVVDDNSGLITRRVGSPTGTDSWHYAERFLGAQQKYQSFIWDKDRGLQNIKYINFDNKSRSR